MKRISPSLSRFFVGSIRFPALESVLQNAVVESLVLHTRILTDILLSKKGGTDDIVLSDLLPGFSSPVLAKLADTYGKRDIEKSPCWQFNKMLAHPTKHRSSSHEYLPALRAVWAHIALLIEEIAKMRSPVIT